MLKEYFKEVINMSLRRNILLICFALSHKYVFSWWVWMLKTPSLNLQGLSSVSQRYPFQLYSLCWEPISSSESITSLLSGNSLTCLPLSLIFPTLSQKHQWESRKPSFCPKSMWRFPVKRVHMVNVMVNVFLMVPVSLLYPCIATFLIFPTWVPKASLWEQTPLALPIWGPLKEEF